MEAQPYIQYRYICARCGQYDYFYRTRPRRPSPDCHFCRGPVVKTAECSGRRPWFVAYGAGKPKKLMNDWMKGGRRDAKKPNAGRPKKRVLDNKPYHAEDPSRLGSAEEFDVADDDAGIGDEGLGGRLLLAGDRAGFSRRSGVSDVDALGGEPGTGSEGGEEVEDEFQSAVETLD